MNNLITNIYTGSISNGNSIILPKTSFIFIKSKMSSVDESRIEFLDENNNVTGSISLEAGERKIYNAPRGKILPNIRLTAGNQAVIEYEFI